MKIYFLSSQPCALTLNGAYFGLTDHFERFAEIDLRDRVFVQFNPENALPVSFFLSEDIRFVPPPNCAVYLLKDGVAVYACNFTPIDSALRPIAQKRDGDCLVTVYAQGRVQMTVQTADGFFNATLPPSFADCEILFHAGLILLRSSTELALYTKTACLLLHEQALEYQIEDNLLRAQLPLFDSLGQTADCVWELSKDACKQTQFTLRAPKSRPDVLEELLPYAFFESVLIGGNYADFLCDELLPDAEQIRAFLGDFIAVTLTKEPRCCGLIRKKAERLFTVSYYAVEIADGKITDIKTAN